MTLISAAQLAALAPDCDAAIWAPLLDAQAARCDIATPLRLAHWLAQIFVESEGLTRFSEDLNYSAKGLLAEWPGRFTPDLAAQYAHRPPQIANRVYGRRMGNGDESTGDGWRYRGRGPLMRTFRGGYIQASQFTGLDLVANPDQLGQPGEPAARDAADFWRCNHINTCADRDDLKAVTMRVNGGMTDLAARAEALKRAKPIFAAAQHSMLAPARQGDATPPQPEGKTTMDDRSPDAAPAPAVTEAVPAPDTAAITSLAPTVIAALSDAHAAGVAAGAAGSPEPLLASVATFVGDTKSIWQSRTVWSASIAALAALAAQFGHQIPVADQSVLLNDLAGFFQYAGLAGTVIFRVLGTKPLR